MKKSTNQRIKEDLNDNAFYLPCLFLAESCFFQPCLAFTFNELAV